MKTTLYTAFILLITLSLQAQVGVGTTNPQAAFDVTATDAGILIPRVALTSTTDILPIINGTESELVYNTATDDDVTPGFYYLSSDTGPWVRFGGATGWLTTGNADITDGVNFMGTSNDRDVAFRRNGAAAGKISVNSTSFGLGALNSGSTSNSVAIGNNALNVNTCQRNVAMGVDALRINTTGSDNVAIGYHSLYSNTNSLRNTAIGYEAMRNMTDAVSVDNVAIGFQALRGGNNVTQSTFVGHQAGFNNSGNRSTGVGKRALGSNNGGTSSGIDNTAIGFEALAFNTTGQQNTGIGAESLYRVTSGRENTAVGFRSGGGLGTGLQNTFLGHFAGTGLISGSNNIIIGYQAQVPSGSANNQLSIGNWIFGSSGNIGIGIAVPTEKLEVDGKIKAVDVNFSGLPLFADEAAALAGGLTTGDLYQTTTGEIRIKL